MRARAIVAMTSQAIMTTGADGKVGNDESRGGTRGQIDTGFRADITRTNRLIWARSNEAQGCPMGIPWLQ